MIPILVLGVILRLICINQSLWLDEAIEALALMGQKGPLLQYALGDYQPPLYHLIGYVTTHLLGYSEIVLRLPSLISSILTIYFVMKIGEYIATKKVGYITGMLVATNPLLIYYSQEGRTYALTTFFVTASFYYLLRLFKEKSRPFYILYSIFTILFLWTSYLAWFVFVVQILFVLYKKRFDIFALQIIAGLTLCAWLPSLIHSLGIGQSTRQHSPEWGKVVGGLSWKSLPLTWVKFTIGRISFANKWLYASIVGGLLLLHSYILKNVSGKKNKLIIAWLIFPVLVGVVVASILPIYQYFRVLFVLPAYLLLLAIGLQKVKARYLCAVIGINILCLGIFWLSPVYHREDWRNLAKDLRGDPIATLMMPSRAQDAALRYYQIQTTIIEPSHEEIRGDRLYYVRYVEDLFDANRQGVKNIEAAGYTIVKQKVYPGIQVDIYEHSH